MVVQRRLPEWFRVPAPGGPNYRALKTLFAVAENYPDLKANVNFLELQRELTDTEDKIQAARRFYNGNVRDYNTVLEQVPTNLVARLGNFTPAAFFELDEPAAKNVPAVKFESGGRQ